MIQIIKICVLILTIISFGVSADKQVVVIPMAADAASPDCHPGFIAATANLDIRSISTTEYSSSGVFQPYTCDGSQILAIQLGSSAVRIMFDDGIQDDNLGAKFAKFGTITADDTFFPASSPLLNCGSNPLLACLSFSFRDANGSPGLPSDSMFLVVYGR